MTKVTYHTTKQPNELLKEGQKLRKQQKYQAALTIFESILPTFEVHKDWANYVYCLTRMGIIYYTPKQQWILSREEQLAKAKTILEKAVAVGKSRLGEQHYFIAIAYHNLSSTYAYLGEYKLALRYREQIFEQQIPILGYNHPFLVVVFASIILGYKQLYGEDNPLLIQHYQQWLKKFEVDKTTYVRQLALLYQNLGYFYRYTNHQRAIHYLQEGLRMQQVLYGPNHEKLFTIYSQLGTLFYEQHDTDLAINYFQKANAIALAQPNRAAIIYGLPSNYLNIGRCFRRKKNYSQSLHYYQQALKHSANLHVQENSNIYLIYSALMIVYLFQRDYNTMISYGKKALASYRQSKINNENQLVIIYATLGCGYLNLQQDQTAYSYYQKAISVHTQNFTQAYKSAIDNFLYLTRYFILKAKPAQALTHWSKALTGCFPKELHRNIINNSHQYPNINDSILKPSLLDVLQVRMRFFGHHYPNYPTDSTTLTTLLFTSQLADSLLNKLRKEYMMEGSKIMMGEKANAIHQSGIHIAYHTSQRASQHPSDFAQAMQLLQQRHETSYPTSSFAYKYTAQDCQALAFEFCEKSKGMVLLDKVKTSNAKITANIPQHLLDKEADLQADLCCYQKAVKQATNRLMQLEDGQEKYQQTHTITELQAKCFNTNEALQQVLQELEANYPAYHQIKYQDETVSIPQLQSVLEADEALISYFVTASFDELVTLRSEKAIYIFCITQNSFQVYKQTPSTDLDKQIKRFLKALNWIRYKKYIKLAHQLYGCLLESLLPQLKANQINKLTIIPHGPLHILPFEALLTQPADSLPAGNYEDLPYLIQQYDVSYHYSASLFYQNLMQADEKQEITNGFVGFAPVYKDKALPARSGNWASATEEDKQELMAMMAYQQTSIMDEGNTYRSVKIGGQKYAALLFSEKEINNIAELLTQSKIETETFLHEQATVEKFKQVVKDKKYIHIAAHGYTNQQKQDMNMTGIIFSPNEQAENDEDCILFLSDTYSLHLNADLVVLSSCQSGIGSLAQGEGVMAMNRGFLYAGAKNVVYTLFKVYDQASSELTQGFFKQILNQSSQKGYAKALRTAKCQLIRQKGYTPKHWAGYVLIGK